VCDVLLPCAMGIAKLGLSGGGVWGGGQPGNGRGGEGGDITSDGNGKGNGNADRDAMPLSRSVAAVGEEVGRVCGAWVAASGRAAGHGSH
jgi:hypothetical protein